MPKYTEYYDGEMFNSCTIDAFTTSSKYNIFTRLRYVAYWKSFFRDMFMPRGYPQSVSADYLNYQTWDAIQAFASYMNSALATEAILRGAGVGNKVIIRLSFGIIAKIYSTKISCCIKVL